MQISLIIMAGAVGIFTTTAMIMDLRTRRLPNWLTVSAFVLALVFHTVTNGFSGLGWAMGGFGTGFGLLFVLWLTGGGGGGDVKLMGALGAWLGPLLILIVFILSAILALAGLLGIFTWRFISGASKDSVPEEDEDEQSKAALLKPTARAKELGIARRLIPYAVPVAIASWAVVILKLLSSSVES